MAAEDNVLDKNKIKNGQEKTDSEEMLIPGFKDITQFSQQMLSSVMQGVKASNGLPSHGDDYDYYCSFQSFSGLMDHESGRILQLMQRIMKHQAIKGSIGVEKGHIDLEDKYDVLVDGNDQLLERVGNLLDEASGIKKEETPLVIASVTPKAPSASWNKRARTHSAGAKLSTFKLLAARYVQRPQIKFKEKIDNTDRPFIPKIRRKPNALKTLEESLMVRTLDDLRGEGIDDEYIEYPHPYQFEIDHFQPSGIQIEINEPVEPPKIEETQYKYVDNVEDLKEMVESLKCEQVIAVDLEHHSYRTYLGLTCLIQISSRYRDWVIDPLALWSDLQILNDVFTDPKIVKVMHGANSDIDWLQRDFGVYVVNLFDTCQASRVLNFSRNSLAHLLLHYCKFEADKQYQLADWRIRPLPEELIRYAREDTHYLLYIYDSMKKELMERANMQTNLLLSVYQRSKEISGKMYQKPRNDGNSHKELYLRTKKVFNSQQMAALKNLFEWRDQLSREQDESTSYVLPNHMLLQMAEILPRESQGVLACCNPIPPLVRQYLNEIHRIIIDCRDVPLFKLEPTKTKMKPSILQHPKYSATNLLKCPHDTSHDKGENRIEGIELPEPDPKLIAEKSKLLFEKVKINIRNLPMCDILSWKPNQVPKNYQTELQKKASAIRMSLTSPFEKYCPKTLDEWLHPTVSESVEANSWKNRIQKVMNRWEPFIKAALNKAIPKPKYGTPNLPKSKPLSALADGASLREQRKRQKDGSDSDEGFPIYTPPKHRKKDSKQAEDNETNTNDNNQRRNNYDADERVKDIRKWTEEKKKKKELEAEERLKDFKPHDYSSSNLKEFDDKNSDTSKEFKLKNESSFSKSKKQRGGKGSGKKSMTYGKNSEGPKLNWPGKKS